MTFPEIFKSEETTSAVKVQQLVELVKAIRVEYGNTELELTEPEIPTTNGVSLISHLSDDDRVALASDEFRKISEIAFNCVSEYEGVLLDREIEAEVATSPVLCNLHLKLESAYL